MTQLTDKERAEQMADMKSFDEQMPCVGSFRYDPEGRFLFDVRKKELTPLAVETAAEKGVRVISLPEADANGASGFKGRIIWYVDKFVVIIGEWAKPIQEELAALLAQEFSLPCFEFVYDEYWNLGHGWSGDMTR